MAPSLKYALVERERRFLVSCIPSGVVETREIRDRYVTGTRVRLREVRSADGRLVRKLNQKVRLTPGPEEVACTSIYLDDGEWAVLSTLPGRVVTKRRHSIHRNGVRLVVDELADGTLLAEIDGGDVAPVDPPAWLSVIREVTQDERWTGARQDEPEQPGLR